MIKIQYPDKLDDLKKAYLELFDMERLKRRWAPVERRHHIEIEDLLVGDFSSLVDIYLWYQTQNVLPKTKKHLEQIFDYDHYQSKIAAFFMNPKNGIHLATCHYCNTAYINSYGLGNTYSDQLHFVNHATATEWRRCFDVKKLSNQKIDEILNGVPYSDLEDFNERHKLGKRVEKYKGLDLQPDANLFDLDHLLPKSKCPILGLSLCNFVPSCQVCNEKLKKDKEPWHTKDEWLKISPTHQGMGFDKDVTIKLIPERSCSTFFELYENSKDYRLDFETNGDEAYEKYVTLFRLRDRYNYHKRLALRILDMKERYTEEKRLEISRVLAGGDDRTEQKIYSPQQIYEDLFQEELGKDRCFSKLRRDMLYKN